MEDRMLSDEILLGIINSKSGGGGGGGTDDYNDLKNQPQIGGVTLQGNMTASDLGLVAEETDKGLSTNDYTDADKAIVGGVTAALADKADKSAVKNEFLGTLAEWNTLTAEQRKAYDTYQIKGDYAEGSGGLPDYSTTEQKTGQKWIDGKDIYCKTIYGAVKLDPVQDWTVLDDSVSYDTMISANIVLKGNGGDVNDGNSIAHANGQTASPRFLVKKDHKLYYYADSNTSWTYEYFLTIYYTKTA